MLSVLIPSALRIVCTLSPEAVGGFDQTCTDTLFGGRKEVIRFWWPWPHFQSHTSLCSPYLLNQMTDSGQTSCIVTFGWFKDLIRFWWFWPNFQGHQSTKTVKFSNFDKKSSCALYHLNQMTDSGQTSYIVRLGWFKDLFRFWWP